MRTSYNWQFIIEGRDSIGIGKPVGRKQTDNVMANNEKRQNSKQ